MAHLQFYCYPGFGEAKREELWYSQAVRVGDYIEIAGQGMFTLPLHFVLHRQIRKHN
jgi:hypothetical protein